MASGPYSRIYHSIVDDPMFERVYDRPVLATWLRMLMAADAMWPNSAPIGRRTPDVRLLIAVGLVIEKPGNRYSMRGLNAERERRSDAGRNAAAVRWQSVRNAEVMPRRDETRQEEKSNGQSPYTPAGFLGFRPKPDRPPGEAISIVHDGTHPGSAKCLVCHPVLGKP
jgi:hypothetical protein